jgi:hypothetical protein
MNYYFNIQTISLTLVFDIITSWLKQKLKLYLWMDLDIFENTKGNSIEFPF